MNSCDFVETSNHDYYSWKPGILQQLESMPWSRLLLAISSSCRFRFLALQESQAGTCNHPCVLRTAASNSLQSCSQKYSGRTTKNEEGMTGRVSFLKLATPVEATSNPIDCVIVALSDVCRTFCATILSAPMWPHLFSWHHVHGCFWSTQVCDYKAIHTSINCTLQALLQQEGTGL